MNNARLTTLAILSAFCMVPGLGAARAGDVSIKVESIRSASGVILVAICDAGSFLTADCPYYGKAPIRGGTAQMTFNGVKPGVYAVQVIHDENGNLKFDTNFLGIPTEGFGFSNDAWGSVGPPTFDAAAIRVANTQIGVRIKLRYLFGD